MGASTREELRAFDPAFAARLDGYDRDMRFWKRMIWFFAAVSVLSLSYIAFVLVMAMRH
jgi:hypothetical protein